MTDAVPQAVAAALDDPFAQLSGPLAGTRKLHFEVAGSRQLTPHMQRIELTAPELSDFGYTPGQDIMLLVAAEGRRPLRRRYTIRALDRARQVLAIDVVLHGDGPGERWVRSAQPGDRIEGIGPRGKVFPRLEADWHLFMGDEAAMPAILAMTESLPGDSVATLVLEVPEPADEQDVSAAARTRVSWLHRLARSAGDPAGLLAEAAEVELPAGDGQAYLMGEASVVLRLRELLLQRGMPEIRMSPKAYWGRGRANASHGEPARNA
jgi:NADPH-dependent ferric siderophore reductase